MSPLSVSVIIPVYNECDAVVGTIRDVASTLAQAADQAHRQGGNRETVRQPIRAGGSDTGIVQEQVVGEWEIVVVDDGSSDGCGDLRRLVESQVEMLPTAKHICVLRHEINLGYGAALKTGIRGARYEHIVITDADGTYPCGAISRLLALLPEADMVVGSRTGQHVHYPRVRMLPKALLRVFAQWIAGQKIPDLNSGLRAFRKSDLQQFARLLPDGFSFTTTLTLAMLTRGHRVLFEPIDYTLRIGRSKFRPIRDTWNFFVTLLRLGVLFAPLKIFLPVALVLFLMGSWTLAGDIFLRQDITDRTVILFLAALQLSMFALLADMISRK